MPDQPVAQGDPQTRPRNCPTCGCRYRKPLHKLTCTDSFHDAQGDPDDDELAQMREDMGFVAHVTVEPVAQGDPKPGDEAWATVEAELIRGCTTDRDCNAPAALEALDALLARAEAAELKVAELEALASGHRICEQNMDAEIAAQKARAEAAEAQLAQAREALREIRDYHVKAGSTGFAHIATSSGVLQQIARAALARLEQGDKDAS